jgi:hypothetical protein
MKLLSTRRQAIVAVGFVVLVGGSVALAQSNKERKLFSSVDPSGAGLEWVVSETRFCSTKPWLPESQVPPLATTAAVQAAIKAHPPKKRWMVTDVSLRASTCGQEFRWYYKIDMYDEAGTTADYPPDSVEQVVLMDGSVLPPRPIR